MGTVKHPNRAKTPQGHTGAEPTPALRSARAPGCPRVGLGLRAAEGHREAQPCTGTSARQGGPSLPEVTWGKRCPSGSPSRCWAGSAEPDTAGTHRGEPGTGDPGQGGFIRGTPAGGMRLSRAPRWARMVPPPGAPDRSPQRGQAQPAPTPQHRGVPSPHQGTGGPCPTPGVAASPGEGG